MRALNEWDCAKNGRQDEKGLIHKFTEDDVSVPVSTTVLIEAVSIALLAAGSYVSTNLDNLVVLASYGTKPGYRHFKIRLAFVFVCLTVLLISYALARAADDAFPTESLRYFGLIPITLGSWQILQLMRGPGGDGENGGPAVVPGPVGLAAYFSFALILLANSSDSVSIMTPLFADLKPLFVLICFWAAVTAAILMSLFATYLSHHPALRSRVEWAGKWILPFLLIGIGLLILTDKPADVFIEP